MEESWQNEWHDFKYQGVMAKAPLRAPRGTCGSLWKTGEGGVSLSRRRPSLEDNGDLKVSVTELQEKLGISEEAGVSIKQVAQQARNENGRKIFETFRRGEEDVCIASWARWNAQLKELKM